MTTIYKDIQDAFEAEVNAIASFVDFAGENTRYRPDLAVNWSRGTLLKGEPTEGSIGAGTQDRYAGIYQVDVFTLSGSTNTNAMLLTDKVISAFTKGKIISSGTTNITIERAWAETSIPGDTWVQSPILIRWFTFATV
tara:strand:- start:9270 stop:9683 length:414 start_codon:yes stop_codon:yes gene_type:complete